MDKKIFDKYLRERYEDQVTWYDKKSMHNQKWAKRTQVVIIILSALTPVSAALNYNALTIVSAFLLTILFGVTKYYKFDELWNKYRTTCETLKKEKYAYEYSVGPYENAAEQKKLFIERVESAISTENTEWITLMKRKEQKKE